MTGPWKSFCLKSRRATARREADGCFRLPIVAGRGRWREWGKDRPPCVRFTDHLLLPAGLRNAGPTFVNSLSGLAREAAALSSFGVDLSSIRHPAGWLLRKLESLRGDLIFLDRDGWSLKRVGADMSVRKISTFESKAIRPTANHNLVGTECSMANAIMRLSRMKIRAEEMSAVF
jgi:hypothetical protein